MTLPGPHALTRLPSGLRVVSEAMSSVRSTALAFWIDTGSVTEARSEAGLSHLLEHMLFRGTERFASEEIDQIFDGLGAELNAATGKDTTSVYTRVLDRHLPRALEVISDMVWRPALRELDAEREVVLEEIAMYEDDPSDRVFDVAAEAVFGEHPLGRPVIGRAEVVAAVDRADLAAFHDRRYLPGRVVVAAAGSLRHEDLVARVAEAFGDGPHRAQGSAPEAHALSPPVSPRPRAVFVTKDTEQYHVCLGGLGIARDDERRFALRVLDNVLGGTSSSRLFQAVRERRGLAYAVYSFTEQYAGAGEVGLYLGTRPDNLARALEAVGDELRRFVQDPITAEELERSRENVKGRTVLALESTATRMNRLGASLLAEMPILTLEEIEERIDAVRAEDVLDLARELFAPERLSCAAIGGDEPVLRTALAGVSGALGEPAVRAA